MARFDCRATLIAALLVSAGCGGGGSGEVLQAPTGLTVQPGTGFDEVILQWTPPPGAFDGYVLEARIGTGPFDTAARKPADPGVRGAVVTIDPSVPELVTLTFRVRAYRGATDSAPSNEASHTRGVRAPTIEVPIAVGMSPDGTASGPVSLRWHTASRVADTVQAERATYDAMHGATGPFVALAAAFPAEALEDADLAPGNAYLYRVRHGRGGVFSDWSQGVTATIDWPLHAAAEVVAAPALAGSTRTDPITVTWTNLSSAADTLELSRAEVLDSGGTGPWTVLPATFPATRFVDPDVEDPKAYAYRVRYSKGALRSGPAEARSEPLHLLVPRDLTVARTEGGYHLAWTNRSRTATGLRIDRATLSMDPPWPGDPPALDPTASTYDLPVAVDWPGTRYWVTAVREGWSAPSATADVPPLELPGPIALTRSVTTLPGATTAARDSALRFHLASSGVIQRPTDTGWEPHAFGWYMASPLVRLDGLDHPHAFSADFVDGDTGRTWTLSHAWHDGTDWRSEVAATQSTPFEQRAFGVDAAGTPHAFFDASTSFAELWHVVRGQAGWERTRLTPAGMVDAFFTRSAFDVAADGTAYLALLGWDRPDPQHPITRALLFTRTAAGAWSQELVPTGEAELGRLALVAGGAGEAGLFYQRAADVWFVGMQGGAWGAPVRLATGGSYEQVVAAVRKSDGRLQAVLDTNLPSGGEAATLCARASGAWTCTPFAPWPQWAAVATGVQPGGKAWVLAFPSPSTVLTSAALYEEP